MSKSDRFTLNTDFDTFKNDNKGQITITLPQVVIGAGATYVQSQDLVIGTKNTALRAIISSSKDSNRKYLGTALYRFMQGTVLGFPAFYGVYVSISRLNASTVRLQINIYNSQSDPLTTAAGAETFTAYLTTFLSPFS